MSYGFQARGSKDAVKEEIAKQAKAIIAGQPEHAADVPHVAEALTKQIDGLTPNADEEIVVSVSGSVSYQPAGTATPLRILGCYASTSLYVAPKA